MASKITYDTDKRLLIVTEAPVDNQVVLDVQADLYSDIKRDWLTDPTLNKFIMPIRSVGGDPLPGSKTLGDTYFLDELWKIRPYEADHKLAINGNLFSEDGTSVMVPTIGNYQVLAEMFVSNLSDSSIAQLTEIEYGVYNGGVTIDVTQPQSGTDYPWGTPFQPVNNIDDAIAIVAGQKLPSVIYVIGDLNITAATPSLAAFSFYGQGKDRTTIDIAPAVDAEDCAYYDCHVTGTLDGNSKLYDCVIDNLNFIKGYIEKCVLSAGTITLAGTDTAHFLDCWSGVPGSTTPTIDLAGSGQSLALRNYNGGIRLSNKNGPEAVSIDLNSGQALLSNTITNGEIVVRGVGKLIDDNGDPIPSGPWNGATIVNETVNPEHIADQVWDEHIDGITHNIPDSAGAKLLALSGFTQDTGVAQGATNNTLILAATASSTPGAYDPSLVSIVWGKGEGQSRMVLEYLSQSKTVIVDRDWKVVPDNTSVYVISANAGREHVNEGRVRGSSSNTITLNLNASSLDDTYIGQVVFVRSGIGQDQAFRITAYDGATKVATIGGLWAINPEVNDGYVVLPTSIIIGDHIANAVWNKILP